jgi:hypothetical protein
MERVRTKAEAALLPNARTRKKRAAANVRECS